MIQEVQQSQQQPQPSDKLILHLVKVPQQEGVPQDSVRITVLDYGRLLGQTAIPISTLLQAQLCVLNGQPLTIEVQRSASNADSHQAS